VADLDQSDEFCADFLADGGVWCQPSDTGRTVYFLVESPPGGATLPDPIRVG
jgi:hypothetical protein